MSLALTLTPVVLTYNEESNVVRTIESLRWAARIVVVDSGSTDTTERLVRSFRNVSFFTRKFDSFGGQWTFAFEQTGIETDYAMALDADMAVTQELLEELRHHFLAGKYSGGIIPIRWCYAGKPLLASFCPPQLRVFRRALVRASQIGHAHHFEVEGSLYRFKNSLWHEDRKSVERWLQSQTGYSRLEEERLQQGRALRSRDRLRRSGWMPAIAAALSYLRAGGPLGGKRALRYAWERATYESILAIRLIDHQLRREENLRQAEIAAAADRCRLETPKNGHP